MKKFLFCFISLLIFQACEKTPYTDRNQMLLFSDSRMSALSVESYDEFMQSVTISTDEVNRNKVRSVGLKITAAVEKYLQDNNISHNFSWSFELVRDADGTVNAFCLPNGNIVFYEGIMPVTQNETGIAVVMGHEIAHAVAKHGNERMSQQMIFQYGAAAASLVLGMTSLSGEMQQLWSTAINVGANLELLHYSRKHELEADELGLIFMAMAGFDPNQAVGFWTRMSELSGGGSTFQLLSTHPSDKTRIERIKEALPEALKYYNN